MRTCALFLSAAAVLVASGCTRSQSAAPQRLELACFAGAPAAPGSIYVGFAPSRTPAALENPDAGPALVGGMFWDPWGPFPDDASIVVNGVAVTVGWIFYVPGFALGAVISILMLPIPVPDLGLTSFTWLPFKVGRIFATVGYYLLAVPLYAIQKALWDAPCALVRFIRLHSKSYKGQVDWLIPRHEESDYGKQVQKTLKKLTGEDFGSREAWEKWWSAHRDEFDADMKRIKPAAPEKKPEAPAAPAPAAQGA